MDCISEKLLSEVLDEEVIRLGSFNTPTLEVEVQRYSYKEWLNINIHELAHKCKEWALQYKYELLSGYLSGNGYVVVMEQRITWYADTEPEAIFKACEYILEANT